MRASKTCSILILAVLLSSVVVADESRGLNVRDLVTLDRISGPLPSPDGERVVFVRRSTDLEADRGLRDLWLVGVDGEGLRALTSHEASDSEPQWAPDGSAVYFQSSRSDSTQVWRIDPDGGEAEQVTDLPLDVSNLRLSPDGKTLAFTIDVFPDCETLACTVDRLAEREESKVTGRLYEQMFVRHWDTWKDGRRSHLFVLPVAGGEPVDLTPGMEGDVPSKPFGGREEIAFTPNGEEIVFTARTVGVSEPWSTDFDLYAVPVDASAPARCLTTENEAWDTQPVFSPDGGTLAYLAMARPGYEADRFRIILMDWKEGTKRVLTESWDRSVGSMFFSADSQTIFVTAGSIGQVALFAVGRDDGTVRELFADGRVRSPALAGDRIVFGRDNLRGPVDLYTVALDGSALTQITSINNDALADVRMGEPEQFSFPGWNDEKVHAYVVKPADFDPAKRYPVAFLVHGGPQGSFGNDFHYRWNPQTYAGAGYAAVMVDFHGSTGYGQAFTDSIRDDWGGKPLEDLQLGLAAALEKYQWLDGDRVCALGASYGGYMMNWIAGNWPERFRCLVNHDGVFDERMMYYATEELWFPEWEHSGTPWENPSGYEKHNPAAFVGNWQTPMLVVHGANDYRIPESQGLAAFTALQRQGIPSQLLYFPDENHWVLKPANSILWHETVTAWLDRWLGADEEN